MTHVCHHAKILPDTDTILEKEENLPTRVQSMLFSSTSNAVMGDILISFNRGGQFFTVSSGSSLSISAQAGMAIVFDENIKMKGSVSGIKVEILLVA